MLETTDRAKTRVVVHDTRAAETVTWPPTDNHVHHGLVTDGMFGDESEKSTYNHTPPGFVFVSVSVSVSRSIHFHSAAAFFNGPTLSSSTAPRARSNTVTNSTAT